MPTAEGKDRTRPQSTALGDGQRRARDRQTPIRRSRQSRPTSPTSASPGRHHPRRLPIRAAGLVHTSVPRRSTTTRARSSPLPAANPRLTRPTHQTKIRLARLDGIYVQTSERSDDVGARRGWVVWLTHSQYVTAFGLARSTRLRANGHARGCHRKRRRLRVGRPRCTGRGGCSDRCTSRLTWAERRTFSPQRPRRGKPCRTQERQA
jgi:hypothetical protein